MCIMQMLVEPESQSISLSLMTFLKLAGWVL